MLLFLIFLLSCLFQMTAVAADQESILLNADVQFKYAEDCFAARDYEAALAEYKRFIYFFPKDERVIPARFSIGMSLFHLKKYADALNQFTALLDEQGRQPVGIESGWMISRCYQRLGNQRAAIDNLIYLIRMSGDKTVTDKAWYHVGWIYLEHGDFREAQAAFDRISPSGRVSLDMEALDADLRGRDVIPRKSPVTAGILSLFPGGGYGYCGRYRDALVAFFFTSAFGYGAVECFDHDLYALGGIMSLAGLGFYSGSIYGGITSAHKLNQSQNSEFLRQLQKGAKGYFSVIPQNRGVLLKMACRF